MENQELVVQNNAITNARYEFTLTEKQIIYLLLSKIKKKERREKNNEFHIDISQIAEGKGKKITNYEAIKEATKKLISRVYEVYEKKSYVQVSLLSSARYTEQTGVIKLRIDDEMMPYLMELGNGFTMFSLKCALNLKSIYAQRLYELLSRWKDTGVFRITVDKFRQMFKLEDKYKGYTMMKKKVLDKAKEEVNEKTDILFTYQEQKLGRKVHEIIFLIDSKDGAGSKEKEEGNTNKLHIKLTGQYKLAEWQAKKIIANVDIKTIHKKLYEIQMRAVNKEISNIGGYTWSIFKNLIGS